MKTLQEQEAYARRRRQKLPPGAHHPTPSEIQAKMLANGTKSGRPKGQKNVFPLGAIKAIKALKFRVREEYKDNEAICEIAGLSFERLVAVMCRGSGRAAPTILKAVAQVRAEICDPIVTEVKYSGTLGIAHAVADANLRILRTFQPELPLPRSLPESPPPPPLEPVVAKNPIIHRRGK
jgi:hypothetical protein